MPWSAVTPAVITGVMPGATRGIRKAVETAMADAATGNIATKDGPIHDEGDDLGSKGTVKECPECGETYTGEVAGHTHKAEMGKAMSGIRKTLRKGEHCEKCSGDKTLMKCETCGCHRPQDAHADEANDGITANIGNDRSGSASTVHDKEGIRKAVKVHQGVPVGAAGDACTECGMYRGEHRANVRDHRFTSSPTPPGIRNTLAKRPK